MGPSLPFMGAEWGGENNMSTTWYPGNADEATQNILNPQEVPSNWHGEWKRTLMGKAPTTYEDENGASQSVVSPDQLVDILEDIFRAGFRLRVTWMVEGLTPDQQGKKVREGRAKKWNFKYTRLQDIEWEVTFDWLGRGRSTQKVVGVRDDSMIAATAAMNSQAANLASLAAAAAFISSNPTVRLSASTLSLGRLESLVPAVYSLLQTAVQTVQQTMSRVVNATQLATQVVNLPFAVANAGIAAARDMTHTCNTFSDQVGQTPPEQMSLSSKVSDITSAAQFYAQNKSQFQLMARQGQLFADKIRQRQGTIGLQGKASPQSSSMLQSDIIAIYLTKTKDTPQLISQKFYQTPDHGADIMRANRLPLYQPNFPSGKVLIIPNLQTKQQGS
jgi:hypothetical protein